MHTLQLRPLIIISRNSFNVEPSAPSCCKAPPGVMSHSAASNAAITTTTIHRPLSLASRVCNVLEFLIDFAESGHNSPPTVSQAHDPLPCNNFAPVPCECPPLPCRLEQGSLPPFLQGVYLRNGPNTRFPSTHQRSHFFDGDGLIHSVTFRGGNAIYCCRFVRTSRFLQEAAAGHALYPKIFADSCSGLIGLARIGLVLLRHIFRLVDVSEGLGLANTGLVYHHGKLLALSEDDLPHTVDILANGDLQSQSGRYNFNGDINSCTAGRRIQVLFNGSHISAAPWAMTSHPKIDPATGEMFAFGYNPLFAPHLTFFRVSTDGSKSKNVPIKLQEASMMHDFGLTKNYVIFPDAQVVLRPLRLLLQGQTPIVYDPKKTPRLGVLPRYAEDDSAMQWFDLPGCNCFHFLNCWEEGDNEIVLIVPVMESVEHMVKGDVQNFNATLMEVRLDLATGASLQIPICKELNLEMGSLNRNYWCEKNKYVYMGVASQFPSLCGVVKVDLQDKRVVASRGFDEGVFASEPFFVPKHDRFCVTSLNEPASNQRDGFDQEQDGDEDEGCLVSFLHHEATGTSRIIVMDPKSSTLNTMASFHIPRRVPYGFHGLFVPQKLLDFFSDS